MKLKSYPEYNDSEVEWIDKIPKSWNIEKLKYNSFIIDGDRGSEYPNENDLVDIGIPFLSTDCLVNNQIKFAKSKFITKKKFDKLRSGKLNPGDLIISVRGTIGNTALFLDNKFATGFINAQMMIIRPFNIIPQFLNYISLSHLWKNQLSYNAYGSAQKQLSNQILSNFLLLMPSKEEQVKIVQYLDKKTFKIDKTIAKDTKLIELLKEKRNALINHVVTKGLDSNAKMKDSGVEWIGEIPEDWEIPRLKFLVSKIGSGITPKGGATVYVEEGIPLLRSQNIHFDGLRLNDVAFITEKINKTMAGSMVRNHDVLLNITGASIGRCTYVENIDKANVNQHVCIIRPETVYYKFLNYFLISRFGQDQIFSIQMGSSREGVNFEQIGNFLIVYPSEIEQKQITEYLDNKLSKINKTIQKIENKIKLMEDYKKSIIHQVVTGKVDVRGDDSLNQIHQKKDSKKISLTT